MQARRRQQRSHELDVRESQEAGIDHVKIANGEPCCTNTPLVLMPKMGSRRSMRLRLKKSPQEPKMDPVDLEAAEWVNRVLANDPMVEVDPVTILEQINAEKKVMPVATISTSEAPDIFHHSNGVPKIPQSVLLATGVGFSSPFVLVCEVMRAMTLHLHCPNFAMCWVYLQITNRILKNMEQISLVPIALIACQTC